MPCRPFHSLTPYPEIQETRAHSHLAPTLKPKLRNCWSLRVSNPQGMHLSTARERMQQPLKGSLRASLGTNKVFEAAWSFQKPIKGRSYTGRCTSTFQAHFSHFSFSKSLLDIPIASCQKVLLQWSFVSGINGIASSTWEDTSREDFITPA